MTDDFVQPDEKLSWRFPRAFWTANVAELFERAAYYGMIIALFKYLVERVGFSDVAAGFLAGSFSSILYLLPTFLGILADKIGFRRALILAFTLLTAGYGLLGLFQLKVTVIVALAVIMTGGAIVKPVIAGTAAKCSDDAHRARAFSIFYAVVNIGAFIGKSAAAPLRQELGLEYINYYAALMAFCALLVVIFIYRDVDRSGTGKTYQEAWRGLLKVISNVRFLCLILIVAGFWAIQHQLYAAMPSYITRLMGEDAKPEWLANINPAVVVLLVIPITHVLRRVKPVNTIAVALLIIPFSALSISLSPALQSQTGPVVDFRYFTLHPLTVMVIIGIALQGVAECFLSPKWLEFASKQAPEGEVGLYMGYMHLSSVFAYLFGFIIAGFMLDAYCPDPATLSPELYAQWEAAITTGSPLPDVYANAHWIWYVFAAVGATAFVALLVFKFVTGALDRKAGR
jgi:dipeptide/tripeptide permease